MSNRDIATQVSDWSAFGEPPLRDQEHSFRVAASSETSLAAARPINEYDALLRTAPGETPDETIGSLQVLREAIVTAQESLTDEHQYVINAIHSERLSYHQLGRRLGISKTHAHRIAGEAEEALRQVMLTDPTIIERLTQ